jgi:glucose-6-phosphate 1-dehydrogenase
VVEPILGDSSPLHLYAPHTWGPAEADRLVQPVGGWHRLKAEVGDT